MESQPGPGESGPGRALCAGASLGTAGGLGVAERPPAQPVPARSGPATRPPIRRLVALARRRTVEANPFTSRLGLFIPSARRPLFYAWYAYFRWVDDCIDTPGPGVEQRRRFLDRQTRLVDGLYDASADGPRPGGDAEALLALLIAFDARRGARLRRPIMDMLHCIGYDSTRAQTIPRKAELERYIELEVSSYLRTLLYFACTDADVDRFPTPYEGIAGKWSHILRDFVSDVEQGIVNVSREDLARYDIRPTSLGSAPHPPALRRWIGDTLRRAERDFGHGKRRLHRHPCLRYKLAVGLLCAKYEYYLAVIRRDRLHLRPTYGRPDALLLIAHAAANWLSILVSHYVVRRHRARTPTRR